MEPKSLSASSAHVFELCPARWRDETWKRTPNSSGDAASLGTAAHAALQVWVETGAVNDFDEPVENLIAIYDKCHEEEFGHDISRRDEGREMIKKWYERTHPIKHEILSTEIKESFPIKSSIGDIPFNYIMDRVDRLPNGDIDVVDYKTIAIPLNADQMREKIQVRCYALAAYMRYPDAPRVWVTYDMLRHGDPLGVSFTKDECRETYKYLKSLAERIIATPEDKAPEQVNPECRFCIRKHACESLIKHASVGGVHGIDDPTEMAERRLELDQAAGAIKAAITELDEGLMAHLKKEDMLEWDAGSVIVSATAQMRRGVDGSQVRRLVSDEIWEEYGGENVSMKSFDKMITDDRLDAETRSKLKGLVKRSPSAPSIKTQPKKQDEDE